MPSDTTAAVGGERQEEAGAPERGTWCVVLGASVGTGAAIARALVADPGLHVFGVHRGNHTEAADRLTDDVAALDRRVHLRVADAGSPEGAAAGADEVLRVAGPRSVHVLVHAIANASVGQLTTGDGEQLHPRQISKTFDSMAHSFVYWVQELLAREVLAPGARLLGLTNPLTAVPLEGCVAISAAKAALEVYARYLAVELGPLGYRVNVLSFGMADTEALRTVLERDEAEDLGQVTRRSTPAGRLVSLDEVARFVSVLAGDAGAWFNGANIDFTGGEALGHYTTLLHQHREGHG